MSVAMITTYTDNLKELVELTWYKNKKLYCEKHDYKYHLLDSTERFDDNDNFQYDKLGYLPKEYYGHVYTKVNGIQKLLYNYPEYSWLMWCDADTLITNFNTKIESFLDDKYHFIIASVFNGINAGIFCIRNSKEGRAYIDNMLRYRSYFMHEQDFIIKTLDMYKNIIKIVPQKTFNSFCFSDGLHTDAPSSKDTFGLEGQWAPGDFLMHWPGSTTDRRIELAKKYLDKVMNT